MKSFNVYSKIALDEKRKPKERILAIYKVDSQRVLYKIAMRDENPSIRLEAIKALTCNKYLKSVARYDEKMQLRIAAVERISNHEILFEIAISKKYDFAVRRKAIEQLKYRTYLRRIVNSNIDIKLQTIALNKLYDLGW